MRLYVAGPITGWPDKNRPAFEAAATELGALGYEVVTPFEHEGGGDLEWEHYVRLGLRLMLTCEGVALLPEWYTSTGAKLEQLVATAVSIPCRDLSEWLDPTRSIR